MTSPFLSLTPENRGVILRAAADTWTTRCSELGLKAGTKGRQRELEAYLQGVLAVATAARLVDHGEASRVAFIVAIGRAEEVVARWAAYRTDEEAAADVRKRTAGAAAEALLA
jgi:hypothetical protein